MTHQTNQQTYPALDILKFILAMSVLIIHFQPLKDFSQLAHHLSADTFARLAVPFFFMSTGYLIKDSIRQWDSLKRRLVKIFKLWVIWSIVYLPFRLIGMGFNDLPWTQDVFLLLKDILLQGVFIHLWYLPAVMFALIALHVLLKKHSIQTILLVSFGLFMVGSLADAYTGLFREASFMKTSIDAFLDVFITARTGLFFGLFFVSIGYYIKETNLHQKFSTDHLMMGFIASLVLLFGELLWLLSVSEPFDFNMRLGIIPSAVLLFMWALRKSFFEDFDTTWHRTMSSVIYFSHFFVHYLVMAVVIGMRFGGAFNHSLSRFILTLLATLWVSHTLIKRAKAKAGLARKLIQLS
jgi:surface polysaccharide O-acyltransferase-like enzyme